LEKQLADLAAKKTERGMVITLGDVLFGTDVARLNPDGMRTAQTLADVLQQNPQRTVLVEGFTDSTGTGPHNQDLSERRASAVGSALQEMGVARERIAIRGYGEAYPVAANNTAQNRQLNRRVEIVLSDVSGKITQR
jgi:outer membrane protein OmpA-like peptidoglycan-associated protein